MKRSLLFIVAALALASVTNSYAVIASDSASASNGAYDDGWQTGDNGGFGLSAWTLQNAASSDFFITSSTVNGDGADNGVISGTASDGDINTPDRPADQDGSDNAWGMRNEDGGAAADALRTFNKPMSVGFTFSIDMDNGFIDTGETQGFGLQNSTSGENKFEFFFVGGASTYSYVDETGSHSSTLGSPTKV